MRIEKAGKSPSEFGQVKLKLSGILQRQAAGSICVLTTHQKHFCCHNFPDNHRRNKAARNPQRIRHLTCEWRSFRHFGIPSFCFPPWLVRESVRTWHDIQKRSCPLFGSPFGSLFPPPQSAEERPSRKLTVPQRRALARNSQAPASFLLLFLLLVRHLPLFQLQLQVL